MMSLLIQLYIRVRVKVGIGELLQKSPEMDMRVLQSIRVYNGYGKKDTIILIIWNV